jgi:integrase
LRQVNERVVSAFLAGMRKRPVRGRVGMAPNTMKVYLQLVHTALRWAADQGLLPRVPKFPSVKAPKKTPQPTPEESFERPAAKAPSRQRRALMLTAWLAGLRVGECYALEWEENGAAPYTDLGRRRIVLPAEFVKGVEDQWVPVDPALQAVREVLPREGRHVFQLLSRDGRRLALRTACDFVNRLAKKAGVKLSMHSLRKGFGCRYAGKVPAQVL